MDDRCQRVTPPAFSPPCRPPRRFFRRTARQIDPQASRADCRQACDDRGDRTRVRRSGQRATCPDRSRAADDRALSAAISHRIGSGAGPLIPQPSSRRVRPAQETLAQRPVDGRQRRRPRSDQGPQKAKTSVSPVLQRTRAHSPRSVLSVRFGVARTWHNPSQRLAAQDFERSGDRTRCVPCAGRAGSACLSYCLTLK